jgi:hypothetical protein
VFFRISRARNIGTFLTTHLPAPRNVGIPHPLRLHIIACRVWLCG